MQEALNTHINAEIFSSYLYLSMSAWADSQGYKGLAKWMRLQALEEDMHVMKFIDFVQERDGRVLLMAVEGPKTEWTSPLDAFNDVCEHEALVSDLINKLVDLSIGESDHATNAFLQWFVTEQVEEEATARDARDKLKLAGDSGAAMYMIDQELGARVTTAQ
jgi:ferritin